MWVSAKEKRDVEECEKEGSMEIAVKRIDTETMTR